MTHDELLAKIDEEIKDNEFASSVFAGLPRWILEALRAVVELCVAQDEMTFGGNGLFHSGRNSMREEIIQAIEKELG